MMNLETNRKTGLYTEPCSVIVTKEPPEESGEMS